ncbi:MAG: hypothetical protein ACI8W3_003680, partial [Myxococcota bacterium]
MNRELAFRIFGLNQGAGDANVRAARAALRAHLDARREAALALGHPRAAVFFAAQLADVDAAATAIAAESLGHGSVAASGTSVGSTQPGARWFLGGIAGLGAVALIVLFFIQPGGKDTARPGPPSRNAVVTTGNVAAAAPSVGVATLRLEANLSGATAQVKAKTTGEVAWQGPADGRTVEVRAGEYDVEIVHSGCPDKWSGSVSLEAGDSAEKIGRNCTQHGLLKVEADATPSRVSIDGKVAGGAGDGEITLPVGRHQVRVEAAGREPWHAEVEVMPGAQVRLLAKLAPKAPPAQAPSTGGAAAKASPTQQAQARAQAQGSRPVEGREYGVTHEWHRTAKQYLLSRY